MWILIGEWCTLLDSSEVGWKKRHNIKHATVCGTFSICDIVIYFGGTNWWCPFLLDSHSCSIDLVLCTIGVDWASVCQFERITAWIKKHCKTRHLWKVCILKFCLCLTQLRNSQNLSRSVLHKTWLNQLPSMWSQHTKSGKRKGHTIKCGDDIIQLVLPTNWLHTLWFHLDVLRHSRLDWFNFIRGVTEALKRILLISAPTLYLELTRLNIGTEDN